MANKRPKADGIISKGDRLPMMRNHIQDQQASQRPNVGEFSLTWVGRSKRIEGNNGLKIIFSAALGRNTDVSEWKQTLGYGG